MMIFWRVAAFHERLGFVVWVVVAFGMFAYATFDGDRWQAMTFLLATATPIFGSLLFGDGYRAGYNAGRASWMGAGQAMSASQNETPASKEKP